MNTTEAAVALAVVGALGGALIGVLGTWLVAGRQASTQLALQQARSAEDQRAAGEQDQRDLRDRAAGRLRRAYRPLMGAIADVRAGYDGFQAIYDLAEGAALRERLPAKQVAVLLRQIVRTEARIGLEPAAEAPSAREVQRQLAEIRKRVATAGLAPEALLKALGELEDLIRAHLVQFETPIPTPKL